MEKIIIDATGTIFGRLCSYVAKQALEGREIVIVNSEKAIISGDKQDIIKRYTLLRRKGGHSLKGPKYSKIPYKMLKRGMRGMLPEHRWGIGKSALKRIRCYDGIPKELKGQNFIKLKEKEYKKFIELKKLSELI